MTDDKALRDELAEAREWTLTGGLFIYDRPNSPPGNRPHNIVTAGPLLQMNESVCVIDKSAREAEVAELQAELDKTDKVYRMNREYVESAKEKLDAERARAQRLVEAAKYLWDAFQGSCDSDHGNSLIGLHEAIAAYECGKPLP